MTCTFVPSETTLDSSWDLIKARKDNIISELSNNPRVSYILSSIEEHEPSDTKEERMDKKPKTKKAKKDLEDAKASNYKAKLDALLPILPINTCYVRFCKNDADKKREVIRVFNERDSELKPSSNTNPDTLKKRILGYASTKNTNADVETYINHLSNSNSDIPDEWYPYVYNFLHADGGGVYALDTPNKKETLAGYAHIHMAIAVNSPIGDFSELTKEMVHVVCSKYFIDVNVKRGRKPGVSKSKTGDVMSSNETGIIKYVLKNSNYSYAYQKLREYPTTLYTSNELVTTYFKNICYHGVNIGGIGVGDTSVVPKYCDLPSKAPALFKQYVIGDGTPIYPVDVPPAPLAINKAQEFINYMVNYMIVNHHFIGDDGGVYTKVPGSKCTFRQIEECQTPDELLGKATTYEMYQAFQSQHKAFISTTSGVNTIYPKIIIDYDWLEFKDFFLKLSTGEIVTDQKDKPCFCYLPKLSLSDIPKIKDGTLYPEMWFSILYNSNFMSKKTRIPTARGSSFLDYMYKMLIPKQHKTKTPVLYGESNAQKSSVIYPITSLYPISKIATITAADSFGFSVLPGKRIAILEEFTKEGAGVTRESLLLLLEPGALIPINVKHKTPITYKNNISVVITGNDISWAEIKNPVGGVIETELDPAILNRTDFFYMRAGPKKEIIVGGKDIMNDKEQALIIMYLSLRYFKNL